MSTKDLSRTVIEGGRDRLSKWDRRFSHREERADERAYLRDVELDPSIADERAPHPRRTVYKSFHDRLAAAERWLLGHVGRPWRKVEGEILATFDSRTLPGRHIVHGHLLPRPYRVWGEPELLSWRVHRRTFFVDRRGVLRVRSARRDRRRTFEVHRVRAEVVAFLAGRRVIVHGDRTYWRQPTDRVRRDGTLAYRQTRELDPIERIWWDALSNTERAFAQTPATPNAEPKTRIVVPARTKPRVTCARRPRATQSSSSRPPTRACSRRSSKAARSCSPSTAGCTSSPIRGAATASTGHRARTSPPCSPRATAAPCSAHARRGRTIVCERLGYVMLAETDDPPPTERDGTTELPRIE